LHFVVVQAVPDVEFGGIVIAALVDFGVVVIRGNGIVGGVDQRGDEVVLLVLTLLIIQLIDYSVFITTHGQLRSGNPVFNWRVFSKPIDPIVLCPPVGPHAASTRSHYYSRKFNDKLIKVPLHNNIIHEFIERFRVCCKPF
jgi:hypothetical protein